MFPPARGYAWGECRPSQAPRTRPHDSESSSFWVEVEKQVADNLSWGDKTTCEPSFPLKFTCKTQIQFLRID